MGKWSLIGVLLLALSACATLSEDECVQGDWRGIGFADGQRGETPDHITQHRKACAEFGITPDLDLWLAGRDEGLRFYCTPQNAYRIGRRGNTPAPVCQPEEQARMAPALAHGGNYWRIGREIQDYRSELSDLREDLATLRDISETPDTALRSLIRAEARLERRISRLRAEQRRYAFWP